MSLRKTFSNFFRDTELGYYLIKPIYLVYLMGLKLIPDKIIVRNTFKRHLGYALNLDNPKTLNEKLNWLKLYNRKDLHTIIADKYKVRAYVEKKIGNKYLVPLYYETINTNDLRPENLPEANFIIKTNHDSSGGLIVRDKSLIDWKKERKKFKRKLNENHYVSTGEWQYKYIKPRIIVEKLLMMEDGSIPNDYKFQFFNGKFAFAFVDLDRHSGERTRNLYDSNWDLMSCEWGRPNGEKIPKPSNFDEMKKVAEKLAEDFVCIRVDFYLVKGHVYFGELTLHHASGLQKFLQKECDYKFGELLNIENLKGID
jgi:hypothetical protein